MVFKVGGYSKFSKSLGRVVDMSISLTNSIKIFDKFAGAVREVYYLRSSNPMVIFVKFRKYAIGIHIIEFDNRSTVLLFEIIVIELKF